MTEQQTHLTQLIEQHQQLISDVNILSNQLTSKRELLLKVQGAIEYLEQTGTTLPEPEKKEEENEESQEKQ
jgi:prefoldin subunit 5